MRQRVRDIIIDTDPGIDDSLALIMALTSPLLNVDAITVVGGNCTVDQCVHNALCIAELVGRPDVPIYRGANKSLARGVRRSGSTVHGETGLGRAELPKPSINVEVKHAVDGLIDSVLHRSGQATIVAIAPMTNLALALASEPTIVRKVSEVIVMGGAVEARGNCSEFAECNIYNDPEAAQIVFSSGMPVTLVPLDVTRRAVIEEDDFDELLWQMGENMLTDFLRQAMADYFKSRSKLSDVRTAILHDPLAMAVAIDSEIVKLRAEKVEVELHDHQKIGKTKVNEDSTKDSATIKIAYDIDEARFLELFSGLMRSAAARCSYSSLSSGDLLKDERRES